MSYPELLGNSLIGFCLVFTVLVLLMCFVLLINAVFKDKKTEKAPVAPVQNTKTEIPEVILENVSEPDAAMIMAIVADESGIPIEKLRFISIREVE